MEDGIREILEVLHMRAKWALATVLLIAFIICHIPFGISEESNERPVAVIQPIQEIYLGDRVVFDGSASYDLDAPENVTDDIISWEWYIRYGSLP